MFDLFFATFEKLAIVIADDISDRRFFDGAFEIDQMIESFVTGRPEERRVGKECSD